MGVISKNYLIIYNLLLTIGWTYVLYLTIFNQHDYKTIWAVVRVPLQICQTAALLEVLTLMIHILFDLQLILKKYVFILR